MKNFFLSIFCCLLIGWQLHITFISDADALLRGVASSGSSGGGTVPSATCANNGGVIYGSAGAFTCNSLFTTDGLGNVSHGGTVYSTGLSIASTGATVESVTSGGQSVFNVTQGGTGNAPQISVGSGTGLSYGFQLGGFGTSGRACIWGTGVTATQGNCLLETVAGGGLYLSNAGSQVNIFPAGPFSSAGGVTFDGTNMFPGVASSMAVGTTGSPFATGNFSGAVSVGSLVANTNGIAAGVGAVGQIVTGSVLAASAVSLGTGTVTTGAQVSLPAGDWDLSATYCYTPTASTTVNVITLGLNTVTAGVQPATDTGALVEYVNIATNIPGANDLCMVVGPLQVLPKTTTSYAAISTATFGASTLKAHGFIRARRMQ